MQISHKIKEKKTFSLKSCDSCKKRLFLNAYTCVKCEYTMCQRNECRTKSETFVCVRKSNSMSTSTSASTSNISGSSGAASTNGVGVGGGGYQKYHDGD